MFKKNPFILFPSALLLFLILFPLSSFARIQKPSDFTGLSNEDIVVVKLKTIYAGTLTDIDGIGRPDFKFRLLLGPIAHTDEGEMFFPDRNIEIYEPLISKSVETGKKLDVNEEFRIRGNYINSIVANLHENTTSVNLILEFFENFPGGLNFFWLFIGFHNDRDIDDQRFSFSSLTKNHVELKLEDRSTLGSYDTKEIVGLLGLGGTQDVKKYYGHSDSNAYAIFEIWIERDDKNKIENSTK